MHRTRGRQGVYERKVCAIEILARILLTQFQIFAFIYDRFCFFQSVAKRSQTILNKEYLSTTQHVQIIITKPSTPRNDDRCQLTHKLLTPVKIKITFN